MSSSSNNEDDPGSGLDLLGLDGGALMAFLSSTLRDLEAAQGEEDDEARGLLAQLGAAVGRQPAAGAAGRQALREAPQQPGAAGAGIAAAAGGASCGGAPLSDLEIASHIDTLTEQLAAVEVQFAALDEGARRIVCQGASVWMGAAASAQGTAGGGEAGGGEAGGEEAAASGGGGGALGAVAEGEEGDEAGGAGSSGTGVGGAAAAGRERGDAAAAPAAEQPSGRDANSGASQAGVPAAGPTPGHPGSS